jgi:hypothetical protein
VAVDLEEAAELDPVVAAAEAVRAENAVGRRDVRADLVGERADVVRGGDDRALAAAEALLDERPPGVVRRVQHVPALGLHPVAAELREARDAPHVGGHAEVLAQQLGGGLDLAQDGARPEQLDARRALRAAALPEQVHAPLDPLLRTLGHRRVRVVLVHDGDVVEDVLLLGEHAPQAVLDDRRDLVA